MNRATNTLEFFHVGRASFVGGTLWPWAMFMGSPSPPRRVLGGLGGVRREGALTRLLRDDWNPIGADDLPADEYASYATRLGGLLREGISEDEIATFLEDVRTGSLGLPARPDEDRRVAALVHVRYLDARRAAE